MTLSRVEKQDIANIEHLNNPVAGDVWQEHFCAYHIVLKVLGNDNIVISERDVAIKDGQDFSYHLAKEITKKEHEALVKYSSLDKFVADVWEPSVASKSMVENWETTYAGRYLTIADREVYEANPEKELDDLIRRVFMSNGFTVKCGESDLKPYVYKAAKELLTELKLIQPNL